MQLNPNTPIISVRQPYAYEMIYCGKDVENDFFEEYPNGNVGGVIGIVTIVDYCRPGKYQSRWANPDAKWWWILQNPQQIEFVQLRGRLGLFYSN